MIPKFANSNFQIDWEKRSAICPKGNQSITWSEKIDKSGQSVIQIRFSQSTCQSCNSRSRCTCAKVEPRGLTIRTQK